MVRFFLLFGVDGLGDLHQDELALAAVFGVEAQHGFGGGAGAGEEVENYVIAIGGELGEFCDYVRVFGKREYALAH